ncbi:gliding motility protein GldG [Candidatus Magnetoovum chiemensis]|nr:gliding motility protein GldG [Candidatus Magnetoovum chiemensis]
MRNINTISRRELSVYFQSIIGYLYIIIFLLITIGIYMTPFFTFPTADMRNFFNTLPIILCIFIPAITMRLWAEERKENTFEMLMTFPMKSYEIVIGKFISAFIFFLISIAATCVIPLMLIMLGDPDIGQIFTSYIGSLLLGSMLLALGIFISGLCKDQITAFILTLLVCVSMFLLGTDFFQVYIDGIIPGFGTFVGAIFGFLSHSASFERGTLELSHIIYFLSWTVLFLFLNGFFLEIRNRPEMKITFSAALVLIIVLGLLLNWILADFTIVRIDLTEGKINTVSDASKKILRELKVPVNLKLYITPKDKMPTELKSLKRDITDKLTEMRVVSNGKVNYDVIYMQAANVMNEDESSKSDKDEAIEKRMLEKGVQPFPVQSISEDSVVNVLIYSAIGIAYKENKEEIIPTLVPQNLNELEYLILSALFKMSKDKMPKIALVAPKEAVKIPPFMKQLYMQMGRPLPESEDPYIYLEQFLQHEKYNVERVELTQNSPLPADFDTLAIINPRDLDDRQKFEINKALYEGKGVFLAVQKYIWDYRVEGDRINISKQEETPNIDDMLDFYGIKLSADILMDESHQPLSISSPDNPLSALIGGDITLNLPIQIALNQESMNPDISITSRLSNLFYLWGGALEINNDAIKKNELKETTLMTTSKNAWTIKAAEMLAESSFNPPADGYKKYPVSVMLTGQFPNFFQDKVRPQWTFDPQQGEDQPTEENSDKPFTDYKKAPSKLIVIGGSQMFRKELLKQSNLDFFMNSIDALSLGEDLINIRAKKIINRTVPSPSNAVKTMWKFINYFLINAIVAFIGVSVIVKKKRSREAYTANYYKGGGNS